MSVIEDPEDDNGAVLALDVEAPANEHKIYSERMKKFKSSWWANRHQRANFKLVIDLCYL